MNKTSLELKNILMSIINNQKKDLTGLVTNSKTDFSRNRKIPYEKMILSLLTMEGASLSNELLRQFGCSINTATSSAFVQQRAFCQVPFCVYGRFLKIEQQKNSKPL